MSDLIERARKIETRGNGSLIDLMADEITRLTEIADTNYSHGQAQANRIGELNKRIAELEVEKLELAEGNIKRWDDSCAMAKHIVELEHEVDVQCSSEYVEHLLKKIAKLEAALEHIGQIILEAK